MADSSQKDNQSDLMAPPPHIPISQIREQLEMQKSGKVVTGGNPLPTPLSQQGYNPELAGKKDDQNSAMQQKQPEKPLPNNNYNSVNVVSPTQASAQEKEPNHQEVEKPQENEATKESNSKQGVASAIAKQEAKEIAKDANIKLLVWIQILALIVIAVAFVPPLLWRSTGLMILGLLLIGMAIGLGVWAAISFRQSIKISPLPNRNGFLVTGGPYKYMRHPMYTALMMASLGLTLTYPTIPRIIALVALGIVLNTKINIEEAKLNELYHHYNRYQHTSGKYWPKFKKPDLSNIDIPRFE